MDACEKENINYIIENCKKNWPDFSITEQNLACPSSDFVMEFYERFCNSMKRLLGYLHGDNEATLQHNTEYKDALTLYRDVNYWIREIELNVSFTLTDLYEPTVKRTRARFILLIHFFSLVTTINHIKDSIQEYQTQLSNYEFEKQKKEECLNKLSLHIQSKGQKEEIICKLRQELELQNINYNNLKQKEDSMKVDIEKMKSELKSNIAIYNSKSTLVNDLSESIQQLTDAIVKPENVENTQKQQKHLETEIEEITKLKEDLNANILNRKPVIDHLESLIDLYDGHPKRIEELTLEKDHVIRKNTELKQLKKSYDEKTGELHECIIEVKHYKDKINAFENFKSESKDKHNQFLKEGFDTLKDLTNKKDKTEKSKVAVYNKKKILQNEITNKKDKCIKINEEIEQLNVYYEDVYKNMLQKESCFVNHINEYINRIKNNIDP